MSRLTSILPGERPAGADHRTAILGGVFAALVLSLGMLLLRYALQVRSVPERVIEWLLLFLPPGLFEATLQRFGFDAKRYALDVAVLLNVALMGLLGYWLLRRGTSWLTLAGVGLGLWLLVMLFIMPLTSAGVFGSALLEGQRGVVGGYLAVALTYVAAVGAVRLWVVSRSEAESWGPPRLPSTSVDRRAALGLLGAAGVAYVGTYAASLLLPRNRGVASVILADPQEPVPSGGLDEPNPHPNLVGAPDPAATTVATTASSSDLPEPTTVRQLARDKDGAVLPGGRKPGQFSELITSNDAFYIVTKNAAGDPIMHPQDWRLVVDGEVERPFQIDYTTLRKLPAVEVTKTLECISNFTAKPELAPFGSELISTARWKGAKVSDILQLVGGVKPGADWLAVLAADEFTGAVPMEVALDPETLLVYEMNGELLPREHGYPTRMLVPGRYGMKNAKWVAGLRPLRREFVDWYGQRSWSKTAVVRTMSRIDQPAPGATLPAGEQRIAGIAYGGLRGIKQVEFSADGGESWQPATILEPAAGRDTWVRWQGSVRLAPGSRTRLVARATDGNGELQVEPFSLPEPDGGTGWPSVEVVTA
jgi:DMSO/TMAO reductase YedYZ molybdopterin-dependent catalytic subunit